MLSSIRSRSSSSSPAGVSIMEKTWKSSADSKQSTQSRKYLGEAHDPHYIPKSPLIERQQFSAEDEAELKRLCTLALSGVPHSDEMTDDPFRYLARRIETRQSFRKIYQQRSDERDRGSSVGSTAASSNTSNRDTSQTQQTTPMTTPGVTPGETTKRFSDAGRSRPATAAPSQLRTEVKTFKGNAVYSFLDGPATLQRPRTSSATKSLTHLPSLATVGKSKTQPMSESRKAVHTKHSIFKQPNFNKSLPSLPRIRPREDVADNQVKSASEPKQKQGAISRMLKSVRSQKPPSAPMISDRGTSTDAPRCLDQVQDHSEHVPTKKQRRFNISHIFSKSGAAKRATVY